MIIQSNGYREFKISNTIEMFEKIFPLSKK